MKDFVGVTFQVCPICGVEHNEAVAIHKRMQKVLEPRNFEGFALCDEHKAMQAEYIALVETSNAPEGANLKPQDAVRTGVIAHVRRAAAAHIFDVSFPANLPFVYVEVGVIGKIKEMTE